MVKVISALFVLPIPGKSSKKDVIDVIFQAKEVSDFLKKFSHRNPKVEWKQSSTSDAENIFTVITAIITIN